MTNSEYFTHHKIKVVSLVLKILQFVGRIPRIADSCADVVIRTIILIIPFARQLFLLLFLSISFIKSNIDSE